MNDFNKQLIFIVGSGRSGTTFLRNILDLHERIAIVPELHFFDSVYSQRGLYRNLNDLHIKKKIINQIIGTINISGDPYYQQINIDYDLLKSKLLYCNNYQDLFIKLSLFLASKKNFDILTEKTPADIFFIDQIFSYFPKAKLIHIFRDGREVCASSHKRGWGNIYNLMALWKESIRAVEIAKRKYPHKRSDIFEVKYEDLVNNTKEALTNLFAFLGLAIDDNFMERLKDLPSFSSFFENKKGIYKSRHFTNYFSPSDQKMINSLLENELNNLDYDTPKHSSLFILDRIRLFLEVVKFKINFWSRRIGCYHLYKKIRRFVYSILKFLRLKNF